MQTSLSCPQAAAVMVALAAMAYARVGRAGTGDDATTRPRRCTLSLAPLDADERWKEATRALALRLDDTGIDTDCRALTIDVSRDRAFLVFTTQDGRQTVRQVRSPDELGPVVDALLVTVAAAPIVPSEHPPAQPSPAPAPAPKDETRADRAVPAESDPKTVRIVAELSGGARLSGPGPFVSPALSLHARVLAGRWEIGAFGIWDPAHKAIGASAPSGFSMSRYAAGIGAGRRVPVGAASLAFGVTTSVVVTNETGNDTSTGQSSSNGGSSGGPSTAEPLVGAYAALVYPARSALRLRSELGLEAVASRIGRALEIDPALPLLPWWSASTSLGVEWEVP